MTRLPAEVATILVRGVGAYIRAVPAAELPPKLKRFKRLDRPRALAPHKDALLEVLDNDELTRARISEWMAGARPPLSKDEHHVLELAVERPDGWLETLQARTGRAEKKAPAPAGAQKDGEEALARAKERTAKARDEVRRARLDADKKIKSARDRASALEKELEQARAETKRLRGALSAAEKRAVAAERAAERVERKGRADAERAAGREKAARDELRSLRREVRSMKDRLDREWAPRKTSRGTPPEAAPVARKPRRRRRLPVPKGRLETAPETLAAWLEVDDVHLLVDGYNVTKARGGFGDVDLPTQRRRLIEAVGKLARKNGIAATIVFDGSVVAPGTSRRPKEPVVVEYSRPGEIADDHLIARLEALEGVSVVVATNDKELQHRAAALGATIATSNQLLALIR